MRTYRLISIMMRRALCVPLFLAALFVLAGTSAVHAQDAVHRAGLVIRFPDGTVSQVCVSFSESSITGEQLLQKSGLRMIIDYNAGLGGAVCSINDQGCAFPVKDCFCKCQGLSSCEYWAYFHRVDGDWQYSQVGASSYRVTDGVVEGWSWGAGSIGASGTKPPSVAFEDVCAAPPTATPTATPTVTLAPTSTPTPTPTATVTPRPVSRPIVTFAADATDLSPGACTILRWSTWDADSVTLDGAPVADQGQRNVCPPASQRYELVAANASGQTSQDLVVMVSASEDAPEPSQLNLTVTASPTRTATPMPSVTPTPRPSPSVPPPAATAGLTSVGAPPVSVPQATDPPASALTTLGVESVVHAQEPAPVPPTAVTPSGARILVPSLLAQPTSTPRPRRPLGADGRATPTPILLARADSPASSFEAAGADAQIADLAGRNAVLSGADRVFHLAMLPGYAAYLLIAAILGAIGAWVVRRNGYR